ncbi:MAG: endonuclease [Candidatus Sumerlaeia bacterium]|nr:endonuclease [Candidatus Sumerlaeia bacterium]
MPEAKKPGKYSRIIEELFFRHFNPKRPRKSFCFERSEIEELAAKDGIKNLGDLVYSFRFRASLPNSVLETQPDDMEWIIRLAGPSRYEFQLFRRPNIDPDPSMQVIKIPDATPEIILGNAQSDEQAILAKIRYNRLLDLFLKIVAYSLQNHLRTQVDDLGQIEIDEVYVGASRGGSQYIVPVQAKTGRDKVSVVQTLQDREFCRSRFPDLTPRLVSVKAMPNDVLAMFELVVEEDRIAVAEQRHYKLVRAAEITSADLRGYQQRESDS